MRRIALTCAMATLGCGELRGPEQTSAGSVTAGSTGDSGPGASDGEPGTTDGGDEDDAGDAPSTGDDPIFDVGAVDVGGVADACKVSDDMNGVGPCRVQSPPDSFDPETQWIWPAVDPGEGGLRFVYTAPLVVNLTDDDDNGSIDLCDVPDVVVIAFRTWEGPKTPGALVILDGATGAEHLVLEGAADASVTPALGDIDDDGVAEIVTVTISGTVVAYEADGTLLWTSPSLFTEGFGAYGLAVAMADLDADEDVEIIAGRNVIDHTGQLAWTMTSTLPGTKIELDNWTAHTAADLDGDGTLEVIVGHSAWHHDGTPYWEHPELFVVDYPEPWMNAVQTLPSVADVDDDPDPEVIVTGLTGMAVLEHDGSPKFVGAAPIDPPPQQGDIANFSSAWLRPSTVHNFDGDLDPEVATSSADHYSTFDITADGPEILWTATVDDWSGSAAGTAFDFLGDGTAEAIYGDQNTMWAFDAAGEALLQFPRSSGTIIEYPTVADVDNDGSAELLIPSDYYMGPAAPGLRVVRDAGDRWIPARRVWNQHTYHVTNVREDGTIPQHEPHHWQLLNTFRTQAQVEGGGVCNPEPAG